MGKKHFYFFETAETGNRTPNSGVKGSGANHYPRAPALVIVLYIQVFSECSKGKDGVLMVILAPKNLYLHLENIFFQKPEVGYM